MGFLNRQKAILEFDYDNLCHAFICHCLFLYLDDPNDKYSIEKHGVVYGSAIDLLVKDENIQYIVQFSDWIKGGMCKPYIAIHQSDKKAVCVETLYKGMDKQTLKFLIRRSSSQEYNYYFNKYPITAGGYIKNGKLYSSQSLDEFMENGGHKISVLFDTVNDPSFPQNLYTYHREALKELWKQEVYDELVESLKTKTFDIYASVLHEHITRKQFKYLKAIIFENLHIEVINERKRGLFVNNKLADAK